MSSWWCFIVLLAGCYLSFPTNKLVSGEHCKIVQDASSGLVWLEDMRYLMINTFIIHYVLNIFYICVCAEHKQQKKNVPAWSLIEHLSNKCRYRARELSVGEL